MVQTRAFLTSRPERTNEPEREVELDPNQDRGHLSLVRLAVMNVLADVFTGMSRQTYFVYDEETGSCIEAVHVHELNRTAEAYGLNVKEIALETAAQV